MLKGQVISGEFGRILMRQKSGQPVEMGELVVIENEHEKFLLQVYDLQYGAQISQQQLELISGMHLEENTDLDLMDPHLRTYMLASLKPVLAVQKNGPDSNGHGSTHETHLCKTLPGFFSKVRAVTKEDLSFITKPVNPMYIGKLRSGSRILDVDLYLQGDEVICHHILIPATTGRGKSNLLSVMLWDTLDKGYCGMLVLDPHDEYYGRNGLGLKDHPAKKVAYYTATAPPPGARTLRINLSHVKPQHFYGAISLSDPQKQALLAYYRKYGEDWIEALLEGRELGEETRFYRETLDVVKRVLMGVLHLQVDQGRVICEGIFDKTAGRETIPDILRELENGGTAIIDTSSFAGAVELLMGSIIATELFRNYQKYKRDGMLDERPVVGVVLEEAPRVLGKDVLDQGPNIFSTIAREGRKFKVGLVAVTQLPSLIPKSILANMNTKIILGLEMMNERQAIIDAAAQDLSQDARAIASLDKGEAIVTSTFTRFAVPLKIPLFKEFVKRTMEREENKGARRGFEGVGK